ncbi:MAG: aminopeptidase N [Bauldia sp.]|nr:aminopeptidase N [Bauldia sp.]
MKTDAAPVRLEEYRAPDFRIDTVHLDFHIGAETTRVIAKLAMRRVVPGTGPLTLMGDELTLVGFRCNGALVPQDQYDAAPDFLRFDAVPEGPFELEIVTELDPAANTQLMGLYRASAIWCTQCEAEGFRRITYFLDRPDVLSVYTTRVEAPKAAAPILLSNGNLVEAGDVPGTDRHYAIWHDPFPKPAYLFALVAGDLGRITDTFTTASGRKVDLAIYCEHGKEGRCGHAMESLKHSMRWDEEVFGREYDLDVFNVVAVSDFNMGAMENKGLNVFNDRFVLADADTATDDDYAHIEGVIAHEYFHNWTGNRITCRDWFQLCLKEGLTVYRDQEFSSDMLSRPVKRIDDVRTLKARQFPEDGGPLAHPVRPEVYHEINNFYTATVYEKGAELVRMLHTILGADGFRAGMDLYFARHDGEAATVEQFLACFADATRTDLSHFKLWYSQAGTPEVVARGVYDAGARRYTLSLAQTCPPTPGQSTKAPLHIPVRFGLVGPNGQDLGFTGVSGATVTGDVIHLTQASQTVVFEGVAARPVPSLLRGFSAPVRLSIELPAEELVFLMRTDADSFNRWQAAQTLAMRALVSATAAVRAGQPVRPPAELVAAFGEVAANDALDPALRAQVLILPGEAEIAREIGRDVDPDAIAAARRGIRAAIGSEAGATLQRLYAELASTSPYTPDAASQGRRALRNIALDLMVAGSVAGAIGTAAQQAANADNMTDRMAALAALNQTPSPERRAALDAFEARYRHDPLVMDKWFALEATLPAAMTLDRVRELMSHEVFSMANPNRVRALIGTFAAANQTQFNRADGAGYDLLADVVLALNARNPQTAARLLVSFRSWRALEDGRRARAEAALRRVAAGDDLSSDVKDIVTRTLA